MRDCLGGGRARLPVKCTQTRVARRGTEVLRSDREPVSGHCPPAGSCRYRDGHTQSPFLRRPRTCL